MRLRVGRGRGEGKLQARDGIARDSEGSPSSMDRRPSIEVGLVSTQSSVQRVSRL